MFTQMTSKPKYTLAQWYKYHKGTSEEWVEYRHPHAAMVIGVMVYGIIVMTVGALWLLCII